MKSYVEIIQMVLLIIVITILIGMIQKNIELEEKLDKNLRLTTNLVEYLEESDIEIINY